MESGLSLAALDVLFTSTLAAYLPTLVPTSMLIAANGACATSSAGASVLGPAVAGTLISALGAPLAIFFDGLSFLASVIGLASLRRPEPPPHKATRHQHTGRVIAEGWSELLH